MAPHGVAQGLAQNLGTVVFGIHFGDDVFDLTLLVNDEGDAVCPHILAAVHTFLHPSSVGFMNAVVLVG